MVRAPEPTSQTSWVLTTMASHVRERRDAGLPHAADPPHPSAGRAYTATLRALTLSMSRGAARVELPPSLAHVARRRNGELLAPRQAPPRHAPVRHVPRRHQSAFDWPDPALRQDDRDTVRIRTCVTDRVPSSRAATCPPGQGRWASTATLSSLLPTARIAQRASSKRHLITESVQPTSFQVHPM